MNNAEEKITSIEEVARDAKGAYYQVASDLEMAETVISKNDEDAAALKAEYIALQRTNEQLINQLGTTAKNSLEKEEYASVCKAEVERADKALLAAVGSTARVKSELQQAEMEAEYAEENWSTWYTDLQNGIDESQTVTALWKHLCGKVSKTYQASQIPGSAAPDEEIAEMRRIKMRLKDLEFECVELKTEVEDKYEELIAERNKVPRDGQNDDSGSNNNGNRRSQREPSAESRPPRDPPAEPRPCRGTDRNGNPIHSAEMFGGTPNHNSVPPPAPPSTRGTCARKHSAGATVSYSPKVSGRPRSRFACALSKNVPFLAWSSTTIMQECLSKYSSKWTCKTARTWSAKLIAARLQLGYSSMSSCPSRMGG